MGKRNGEVYKKDMQMSNKDMKRYSTSFIREIILKIQWARTSPTRIAIAKQAGCGDTGALIRYRREWEML